MATITAQAQATAAMLAATQVVATEVAATEEEMAVALVAEMVAVVGMDRTEAIRLALKDWPTELGPGRLPAVRMRFDIGRDASGVLCRLFICA